MRGVKMSSTLCQCLSIKLMRVIVCRLIIPHVVILWLLVLYHSEELIFCEWQRLFLWYLLENKNKRAGYVSAPKNHCQTWTDPGVCYCVCRPLPPPSPPPPLPSRMKEEEQQQVVAWADPRSELLQGHRGHVLMGRPACVSETLSLYLSAVGWLAAWLFSPGQIFHRVLLPHVTAGKDIHTPPAASSRHLLSSFPSTQQRWVNVSEVK